MSVTPINPNPSTSSEQPLPPAVRFRQIHDELLNLEKLAKEGKDVDLKHVQNLVRESGEIVHTMQLSTAGPKKKTISPEDKAAKAPKAKKASSISHLQIEEF